MPQFEIIEPTPDKFEELAMILNNLRLFTILWEKDFKVPHKESKLYWQARADAWLDHNYKKIK